MKRSKSSTEKKKMKEIVEWRFEMNESGFVEERDEVNSFQELLKISGGSSIESVFSFLGKKSNTSIEISHFVRIIESDEFHSSELLREVIVLSKSRLRKIDVFCRCTLLCRIEIPSSVEQIGEYGFSRFTSLTEVIFSSGSCLRNIDGFCKCTSFCRIEMLSLVEVISSYGFCDCRPLRVVVIGTECRLRENRGLQMIRPFLVYERKSTPVPSWCWRTKSKETNISFQLVLIH
jgi:hypothetical protein